MKAWNWIENNIAVGGNGTFILIGKGANKLIMSSERLRQLADTNWDWPIATLLEQTFALSHSDAIGIDRALTTWVRQGEQLKFPNPARDRKWAGTESPTMPW